MLNPLDVEQRYQNLLFALSLPGTSFQRLRPIERFLAFLAGKEIDFESYILDCLERVPPLVRDLSASGQSPEEMLRVYERLREVPQCLPAAANVAGLQQAVIELRHVLCGLLAYATAWGELGHVLGTSLHIEQNNIASRLGSLKKLGQICDSGEAREVLQHLYHEWEGKVKVQPGRANVPVIERSLEDEQGESGALRQLSLTIFGETGDGRDAIHEDLAVFGADRKNTGLADVPLQAAHSLLRTIEPRLANKTFAGQITFGNSHELHEGNSAHLAATTLFVCGAMRHTNRRKQYRLQPDAALTGALDAEGNVLAVDPDSLPAKVAAAFYSHIETLVVPKGQAGDAEQALQDLQKKYPGRSMHIVGAKHAREVFFDRRVVAEVQSPFFVHAARGIVRRRVPIVVALAFLGLVFAVTRLALGPIDNHPADVQFIGNVMTLRNQFGEVVNETPVDEKTAAFQADRRRASRHILPFGLIDDDGEDSIAIVFSGCSRTDQPLPDEVRKWSLASESYDWIWRPLPKVDFPLKNYEARGSAHFVSYVAFVDIDNLPGREVLVVSHHPYSFPGVLTVLSRHTGEAFTEYLHVGFINDIRLFDIDSDGSDDILLCGVNNAYRMAFIAVLDPRLISGSSPTKGEYICSSHPPAAEKYYILIPQTVVGQTSNLWKNNNAESIIIDQPSRQITVRVEDGLVVTTSPPETVTVSLNYRFDATMSLTQIAPGDAYDLSAEKLVEMGALQERPSVVYFEAQKDKMRYWDGKGWSSVATMNMRYKKAKDGLRIVSPKGNGGISEAMR